jgi:hypothetical protein
MTKQNQQQPQQKDQQQQQNTSQRGKNPEQQGGQKSQGQPGTNPGSQGQPGARQSDQGSGSQKGSQRGQTSNQQGVRSNDDDDAESPEMNQAGEQSSDKLRQGALDTQYGTSSSSKTDQQTNRPQGSESTGSDRDTLSGSRNKDR